MTRLQLRNRVRQFISEPTAGYWSDDELNEHLNQENYAVNTLISQIINDYFNVIVAFNTLANVTSRSYDLPNGFRFARRVTVTKSGVTTPLEDASLSHNDPKWGSYYAMPNGTPCFYNVRGAGIDLFPIPDAVYPITVFYDAAMQTFVDDTSTPLAPESFHEMIALGAGFRAGSKDQKLDLRGLLAQYERYEERLINEMEIRRANGQEVFHHAA